MATTKLRFGTLNLQNLQLPGEDMHPRSKQYTTDEYNDKITWLAEMVNRMDADVYGFQELWNPECLHDVFAKAGKLADFQLICADETNTINVAAAVRNNSGFKVRGMQWHEKFPEEVVLRKRQGEGPEALYEMSVEIGRFARKLLELDIDTPPQAAPPIRLFVAHLKSKLPMELDKGDLSDAVKPHAQALGSVLSTIRRTAEAGALRVILTKLMKGTNLPVVVIGDLNDAPSSVTTSIISQEPSFRLRAQSTAGCRSDCGLYSAMMLQELHSFRDVFYTYIHEGRHESLDHVLVSEQFYDYSEQRQWSLSRLEVFNDHLDERQSHAELIRLRSDHAGMVAEFVRDPA
ncbi:MAG: endonuclease/exonuclease/phosphatase family protein [Deltaproteobacteria bacterium]|nr:endonuclease/exonuclease/phosphatase family protein [Deltaproteobacteria bacterium]